MSEPEFAPEERGETKYALLLKYRITYKVIDETPTGVRLEGFRELVPYSDIAFVPPPGTSKA